MSNTDKILWFFETNGIELGLIGKKDKKLFIDKKTGECLNCNVSDDARSIVFNFSNNKQYSVNINKLNEEGVFNFTHWVNNSTRKKIYVFMREGKFYQRYFVKDNRYIPIFTTDLDSSYFCFTLQKALVFSDKMSKKGINLNIKREWKTKGRERILRRVS